MPTAILKFKLPEEESEFKVAQQASTYLAAISSIMELLRKERKYGKDRWSEVETAVWEILKEYEVDPFA